MKALKWLALMALIFFLPGCPGGGSGLSNDAADDLVIDGECTTGLICAGRCIDPLSDSDYCGATTCTDGVQCDADQECDGTGHCSFSCGATLTNCGVCVDLQADRFHCGACDNECAPNEVCYSGVCGCEIGYEDCDKDPSNGCEINIDEDISHCGKCELACSTVSASAICVEGACTTECQAGYGDCDGLPDNGCETNLQEDPKNCGECGSICSENNSVATCSAGQCELECYVGWGDCDEDYVTGCETDITVSLAHCGTCGNYCDDTNSSSRCDLGSCLIDECNTHYMNCNGDPRDGCEVNTFVDPLNCGGCSTQGDFVCTGSESCVEGECK